MKAIPLLTRTGVAVATLAAGLALAAPNAFATPAWSIVPTPDPASSSAFLQGVSCPDASTCLAVGYTAQGFSAAHLLAERWDGTSWAKTHVPAPSGTTAAHFSGISCTAATSCMAIGAYSTGGAGLPLAEQWNGTAWSIVPAATPASGTGSFIGVACSSTTACTAVGSQGNPTQTLAERWNGTSWTVQTTPDPAGVFDDQLQGVACPSATVCFAAGIDDTSTGGHSVAAVWRTGVWTAVTVPEPGGATQSGLLGVSCGAVNRCQAVGFAIGAVQPGLLAEAWDGVSLTATVVPGAAGSSTGELSGVSCTSGTVCRAAGEAEDSNGLSQPVAAVLRNGSWTDQPVATQPGTFQAYVSAVSCASGTSCTAVGDRAPGAGGSLTLAEHSSGAGWRPQKMPATSPAFETQAFGVDCLASSDCASVGEIFASSEEPLAQSWDGTRWTFAPASGGTGAVSATYAAVSCAGACVAIGSFTDSHGNQKLFSATRTTGPFGWSTVHTLPLPGGVVTSVGTEGISCTSSTFCVAVGFYFDGTNAEHPLIEKYNGSSWSLQAAAETVGVQTTLSSVSCRSTTACLAVGGDDTGSPVAEVWNGSSWQFASPPPVSGSTFATLSGVSCRSASACVAVGLTDTNGNVFLATWTSGVWARRSFPLPTGADDGQLFGVSCPAGTTTCTAVGEAFTATGTVPLAVQGSGASWTGTLLPAPANATTALLTGVRCFSASDCEADGYSSDEGGVHSALAERLH